MPKYDYPDPGQDPAYCDGLVAEDPIDMYVCCWCHETYASWEYYPYCSSSCELYAEMDAVEGC